VNTKGGRNLFGEKNELAGGMTGGEQKKKPNLN